ncbi:MAG: YdcF family protein [Planctomycetota bacterium]|jgi:uncharacterized SAM-binding protein YcdF (DUF218 family)
MTRALALAIVLAGCGYYRIEPNRTNLHAADVTVVPGYELSSDGEARQLLRNRMLMSKNGIGEARKMKAMAVELGVPADSVAVEPRATSTRQNGLYAAQITAFRGWKSGLLVSDHAHLMYAVPEFRDAFKERGLTLYWAPVNYGLVQDHPDYLADDP